MRPHTRVAWQQLDGRVVLLDLERGRALGLNETASFLWTRLGERDPESLANELAREFRLDDDRARRDVSRFVSALHQRGFLESE